MGHLPEDQTDRWYNHFMLGTKEQLIPSGYQSYWAQYQEKKRWASVRDAEERELMAFIHEILPENGHQHMVTPDASQWSLLHDPNAFHPEEVSVRTMVDYWPAAVTIPEKEAIQICSIVCLINTPKKRGLYLLRNGEWIFFERDLLMVQVIEQFYRRSLYPANRRGVRSMEMRHLCETRNHRSADSMLSQCINKRIRDFCKREGIPDLIVDCGGKKKCFRKF